MQFILKGDFFMEYLKESQHIVCVSSPEKTVGTILGQVSDMNENVVSQSLKGSLNGNIAVFANGGSGDVRAFSKPYITQCIKRGESIVVADTLGRLRDETMDLLVANGYKVKILDLLHLSLCDQWDIMGEIRTENIFANDCAKIIIESAQLRIEPSLENEMMSLLETVILYVAHYENDCGFGRVYEILKNGEKYMDKIIKNSQPLSNKYSVFKRNDEIAKKYTLKKLTDILKPFENKYLCRMTSAGNYTMNISELTTDKCAYFCIISEEPSCLDFISSLFFSTMLVKFRHNPSTNNNKIPIKILLANLAAVGRIHNFYYILYVLNDTFVNIAMKRLLFLVICVFNVMSLTCFAYSDISNTDWFYPYVSELSNSGVINGYGDGTFKPHSDVTQEEFTKMVVQTVTEDCPDEKIEEIAMNFWSKRWDDWAQPYLTYAVKKGFIEAHGDTSYGFKNKFMSRERAAKLVIRALNACAIYGNGDFLENISDLNDTCSLCRPYINQAYALKIMNGYEDNSFRGRNSITRAEAAAIIYRTSEVVRQHKAS